MIYKAKITEVPKNNDNEFKVDIYSFRDNTTKVKEFTAILANEPGIYSGYKAGDTVFVSDVENGEPYSLFVILGKLYDGTTSDGETYISTSKLKVADSISLPDSTTIGGWGIDNFFSFAQQIANLETGGGAIKYVINKEITS